MTPVGTRLVRAVERYAAFMGRHVPGYSSPWFGRAMGQALIIEDVWMLHETKAWLAIAWRVAWGVLVVAMLWHLHHLEDKRYELANDLVNSHHEFIEKLAAGLNLTREKTGDIFSGRSVQ